MRLRLKRSSKLFADETTGPVLDPGRGRTKTGQLWAYARDDRPWGGCDPPAAAYRYAPDRKAERPIEHLAGFKGVLQVDGYISRGGSYSEQPQPIVTHFEGKRLNSPNDIIVERDGAIWFTDPVFGIVNPNQGALAEPNLDHRSAYRFDPVSRALRRMADFEQPNGLAFDDDKRILYVSDTSRALSTLMGEPDGGKHEILACDGGADNALSGRRLYHRTERGNPDGFKVDRRD